MRNSIIAAIALAIAAFAMPLGITSAWAEADCEAKRTPLHKAIDAGKYKKAQKHIKARNGHYVNVIARYKNSDGEWAYCYAPLHRALQRDDGAEISHALLAAGADVHAKNQFGDTPLHYANNAEIVQALIAKGADVHAKSNSGQTPLHQAAFNGRTKTAIALIAKGADVNAKDKLGRTPLYFSVRLGFTKTATALIAKGVDVNAKDNWGETILHLAAKNGRAKIAQTLIKKGADVDAKDKSGMTPLFYAAKNLDTEITNALIKAGANLAETNNQGQIPKEYAMSQAEDGKEKDAFIAFLDRSGDTKNHGFFTIVRNFVSNPFIGALLAGLVILFVDKKFFRPYRKRFAHKD